MIECDYRASPRRAPHTVAGVDEPGMIASTAHQTLPSAVAQDRALIVSILATQGLSLRDFSRPSVWHTVRYVLTCWTCVAVGVLAWTWGPWGPFLAVAIFAFTQHAMLLLTHEASHLSLLPYRGANYLVGNIFFALPVGQTVGSYAVTHAPHHRYLNTNQDTSFFVTNPELTNKEVLRSLFALLCGRVVWDLLVRTWSGRRAAASIRTGGEEKVARVERIRLVVLVLFHGPIILTAFYWDALWIWIAWTLSTITLVPFLDGIRAIGEHRKGSRDSHSFHTRSHHVNAVLSAFCAPFFQYHWEHHAVPAIPHHQLARLHRILVACGIEQARPVAGGLPGAFLIGAKR